MAARKEEVVAKVAEMLAVDRKEAAGFVSVVLDAQMKTLAEHGELTMRGFGTFRVKEVVESWARNPRTGERVPVPPHKRVRFRPGKIFRDIVAGRR